MGAVAGWGRGEGSARGLIRYMGLNQYQQTSRNAVVWL